MSAKQLILTMVIALLFGFAGGFLAFRMAGCHENKMILEASEFSLVDDHGTHFGGLELLDGDPTLWLGSRNGRVVLSPTVLSLDKPGKGLVMIALNEDSFKISGSLDLHNELRNSITLVGSEYKAPGILACYTKPDSSQVIQKEWLCDTDSDGFVEVE